ncbi:hypothetical protein GCM10025331_68640 [Actinoplanes utahensis]|nr:hypothetical protein Aut01nite_00480 [Actinoplanes utahensis]
MASRVAAASPYRKKVFISVLVSGDPAGCQGRLGGVETALTTSRENKRPGGPDEPDRRGRADQAKFTSLHHM